jgi:Meiotically Up-regulated Gene 113 (MUG113) protein
MPVYFIQAGDDGPVKIGWAKQPAKRIAQLQTGHHVALNLLRLVDGDLRDEARFHKAFREQRIVREWFMFDPLMLTLPVPKPEPKRVVDKLISTPKMPRMTEYSEVRDTLEKLGGINAVASTLGLTRRAVKVWIKNGRMPYYWQTQLAEMARGKIVLPEHLFFVGAKRGRKPNAETKEASAA